MRRFFINASIADEMVIDGADARHIVLVLRLTVGDMLLVAGTDGKTAKAEIINGNSQTVHLRLVELIADNTEPPVAVWLVQGLAKGEKMDFIVQKAVELGVAGIIPVMTDHCVVKYDQAKQADKVARWQKIAREAAKQCGRNSIPPIYPVTRLADIFTCYEFAHASKIMLYEGQACRGLKQTLAENGRQTYLLFIGPEGGFSFDEVNLCQANGAKIATMGPRIMRTETAALAALSAVMFECGDLGG